MESYSFRQEGPAISSPSHTLGGASCRWRSSSVSVWCRGWRMEDVVSHVGLPVCHPPPPRPQSPEGIPGQSRTSWSVRQASVMLLPRQAALWKKADATTVSVLLYAVLWVQSSLLFKWTRRYFENLCSRTSWMHALLLFIYFCACVCVCVYVYNIIFLGGHCNSTTHNEALTQHVRVD